MEEKEAPLCREMTGGHIKKIACLFHRTLPSSCTTVCCQTHLSSPLTLGRAKSFTLHHWFTPWETSCELQSTLWSNFLKGTSIFTNVFHMIKLWNLSPVWQYLREVWGLERKCLWSALSSTEGKRHIHPRCYCTPWCSIGATVNKIA